MNKRPSRPQRFAAVDNDAIDKLPSMLAVGMLTAMIRAKDGDDVTVASLCEKYSEGREAVTKTMRILVEEANVVKFKIQRAINEDVINEAGEKETKRGGSWYTTFSVDSIPFTAADVAEMVDEIYDGGNVKALRVEPERLDPRKSAKATPRPRYGKPSVGPTCGNEGSDSTAEGLSSVIARPRPTDGFPTVGRPTAGQPSALYRKKTVLKDSLSADPGGQQQDAAALGTGEREEAFEKDDKARSAGAEIEHPDHEAHQVLAAYEEALGGPALNGTRKQLLADAAELLASRPLWWVIDRAQELPKYGTNLGKHAAMSKVPFTEKASAPRSAGLPEIDPDYVPVKRDVRELVKLLAKPSI